MEGKTKKNVIIFLKYIFIASALFAFIYLYNLKPFKGDKLTDIQGNLINVSGIISAIVLVFLTSKILDIVQKKRDNQRIIDEISIKLTDFRKILYCIMKSHDFWERLKDVRLFKAKYPGLTFSHLHSHINDKKEEVTKFWLEETELSSTTIDLYMAMEEITEPLEGAESWFYDYLHIYHYSVDYLERCVMPSNQIWYYLEGRYAKHTDGLIHDDKISVIYEKNVRDLVTKINPVYKSSDVDRVVIADIAAEFHEKHLPITLALTKENEKGIPVGILLQFITLTVILIAGVVIPLGMQTIDLEPRLAEALTFSLVGTVLFSLIDFLFDFFKLLNSQIRLKDNS
jgi:hypothetical protein